MTATKFRQWATARLKEYMQKGFTMDDERLKNLGGGGYFKELLERIRDIRASEKVVKTPMQGESADIMTASCPSYIMGGQPKILWR